MEFVFLSNFANNWKAGQEVEVTEVPGHDKEFLVDSVALIPKSDLLQHDILTRIHQVLLIGLFSQILT